MNGDDMASTRSISRGKWLIALIASLMVSAFVSGCSISARNLMLLLLSSADLGVFVQQRAVTL